MPKHKHKPPTRDVFVKLFVLFAPTPYQHLFLINATPVVNLRFPPELALLALSRMAVDATFLN